MIRKLTKFFALLKTRMSVESPKFFAGLRRFSLWVGALATTATPQIQALIVSITGLGLDVPAWVNQVATYVAVGGYIAAFVANLTVDPQKLTAKEADQVNVAKP